MQHLLCSTTLALMSLKCLMRLDFPIGILTSCTDKTFVIAVNESPRTRLMLVDTDGTHLRKLQCVEANRDLSLHQFLTH